VNSSDQILLLATKYLISVFITTMKKLLLIIGLLVIGTQVFSQGKDKHALLVNEAEKKAINLMRPVDLSQQIIDAIKFPADFSTNARKVDST
jgi:hypothetical protein